MLKILRNTLTVLVVGVLVSSCATTPVSEPEPTQAPTPVAVVEAPSPTPAPALDLKKMLAGMPAQNAADRDSYAAAVLADSMGGSLNKVLAMLVAPGTGDDTKARFALDGIAKHCTRAGGDADLTLYRGAVLDALAGASDKEVKAYLIRQLELLGGDDAVEALAGYLEDDRLVEPAVAALLNNGSDAAAKVLLDGLTIANDVQALPIVKALGTLQYTPAKKKFKTFSMSTDRDLRYAALYALANLGESSNTSILESEVRRSAGYDQIEAKSILRLHERRVQENNTNPVGVEAGYVSLFNGKDLTGWVGDTKGYVADNGVMRCLPGGNLYTEIMYGDFSFKFSFKLNPGGNNGLAVRVPMGGGSSNGMELQILDDDAAQYMDLKTWQYHGSVYGIVPAKRGHLKPVGQWNDQEVIARGRQITVILNGVTILDTNLDEALKDGPMDGKPHANLDLKEGHLGFLGHGNVVEFRGMRIKEL